MPILFRKKMSAFIPCRERRSFVMPVMTEAEPTAQAAPHPECYRLPKPGQPGRKGKPAKPAQVDPYFGFSRSFYYEGEKRGYWRLVRIRGEGKDRGVTLIPYADVAAFVRKQVEANE